MGAISIQTHLLPAPAGQKATRCLLDTKGDAPRDGVVNEVLVNRHPRNHQADRGGQPRERQRACAVGLEAHLLAAWGAVVVGVGMVGIVNE